MRARAYLLVLVILLVLMPTARAFACPVCDSPVADEVRSGLLDDLNPTTFLAVAAPFAVVTLVVAAVHFGTFRSRR